MKPYRLHVFVCQGKRCGAKGSEDVLDELKEAVKKNDVPGVKISKSGCLKMCKETSIEAEHCPAVVVYPDGIWYRNVTKKDVAEIVETHLKKGAVVERLHYFTMKA